MRHVTRRHSDRCEQTRTLRVSSVLLLLLHHYLDCSTPLPTTCCCFSHRFPKKAATVSSCFCAPRPRALTSPPFLSPCRASDATRASSTPMRERPWRHTGAAKARAGVNHCPRRNRATCFAAFWTKPRDVFSQAKSSQPMRAAVPPRSIQRKRSDTLTTTGRVLACVWRNVFDQCLFSFSVLLLLRPLRASFLCAALRFVHHSPRPIFNASPTHLSVSPSWTSCACGGSLCIRDTCTGREPEPIRKLRASQLSTPSRRKSSSRSSPPASFPPS